MLWRLALPQKSGQQPAVIALPFGVDFLELGPSAQPAPLRQRLADSYRRNIKARDQGFLIMRRRQPFAAFGAAALEHEAAILGRHAGAKAVRLGAASIVRLKGSLWHR